MTFERVILIITFIMVLGVTCMFIGEIILREKKRRSQYKRTATDDVAVMLAEFSACKSELSPDFCSNAKIKSACYVLPRITAVSDLIIYYEENRSSFKSDEELLTWYADNVFFKNCKKYSEEYKRFFIAYFAFLTCLFKQRDYIEEKDDLSESEEENPFDYDFYDKEEYSAAYKEAIDAFEGILKIKVKNYTN